jgi:hypothetical protein
MTPASNNAPIIIDVCSSSMYPDALANDGEPEGHIAHHIRPSSVCRRPEAAGYGKWPQRSVPLHTINSDRESVEIESEEIRPALTQSRRTVITQAPYDGENDSRLDGHAVYGRWNEANIRRKSGLASGIESPELARARHG